MVKGSNLYEEERSLLVALRWLLLDETLRYSQRLRVVTAKVEVSVAFLTKKGENSPSFAVFLIGEVHTDDLVPGCSDESERSLKWRRQRHRLVRQRHGARHAH